MIIPDLPINCSAEDKLNRSFFAEQLSETLVRHTSISSFVIGLYGAWGSGKTSLLNMVLENVKSNDENIVVFRFNPWLCADEKQMIQQFFIQLSTTIKFKKPTLDTLWKLIDQYGGIVDAANGVPILGASIAAFGRIFTRKAKAKIERQNNDLQGKKNHIVEELKNKQLKIIVAIDDIDRLSEKEIIAVFQLVKALADFPNTTYLLLFDYDVVIKALAKIQHGDGKAYLEKVIQVPFEIPAPSLNSIHQEFYSKLEAILGDIPEDKWDREIWSELVHCGFKNYVRSIRDTIRFSNVFSLKYNLLKEETDVVDLLGLTCLQVFEPQVYAKLPYYREMLCGVNSHYSYEDRQEEEKNIKRTMSVLAQEDDRVANPEAAECIIALLFPRMRSNDYLGFRYLKNYTHKDFLIQHKIATPECFMRYFALSLESDAISSNVLRKALFEANGEKLSAYIEQFNRQGKIIRLLDEISAYASDTKSSEFSAERASQVMLYLVRLWPTFEIEDWGGDSVPSPWRLLACVDRLLELIEMAQRCVFVRGLFEDYLVQPSTLALLLQDFETQHGRFTEKKSPREDILIPLDEVLVLEAIFKERALDALDSRAVLQQNGGLNIFWMLNQIDAELAKKKKKSIVTDTISLVKVIGHCISNGSLISPTIVRFKKFNPDALKEFVNPQESYINLKEFVLTSAFWDLKDEDQKNVITFLLSYERNFKNSFGENGISEDLMKKELSRLKTQSKNPM